MGRRYDNLYADKPVKFQFDVDMIKLDTLNKCWFCQSETAFFDIKQSLPICSDDCRLLNWQRTMKEACTGTFNKYVVDFKNGTNRDFGKVRAWFRANEQGSFLYLEQLDLPTTMTTRWDVSEISDIHPGGSN